jgi:hypothetical protein
MKKVLIVGVIAAIFFANGITNTAIAQQQPVADNPALKIYR